MRRVLVLFIALAGAVGGLVACSDDAPSRGTAEEAAGPLGEASVEPAGRALVPTALPEELVLRQAAVDSARPGAAGTVRVYGDTSLADPLAGPIVAAMWEADSGAGYLSGSGRGGDPRPGVPYAGAEPTSGADGSAHWMTWSAPNGTQDPDSAGVVARGLMDEQVQTAAESLRVDGDPESGLDGTTVRLLEVPEGLAEVVSGPVSLSGLDAGYPPSGSTLRWEDADGSALTVISYEHDRALALLLRIGIDDVDGTVIRGVDGAHGSGFAPSGHDADVELWTWTEDGMDVLAIAEGLPTSAVQRAIDSLTVTDDWDALIAQASVPPPGNPTADAFGPEAEVLVTEGGFPGGWWRYTVARRPDERAPDGFAYSGFTDLGFVDGGSVGVVTDGGFVDGRATLGVSWDERGTLVHGSAPEGIERLEVELADGSVLRPKLVGGDGTWPGALWGDRVDTPAAEVVDVRGYDAGGGQRFVRVAQAIADSPLVWLPRDSGGSAGITIELS